jgi:hypothetical protein
MIVGVLLSGSSHPAVWSSFVVSRAQQAQSHERRFLRALSALTWPWRAIYQHVVLQALQDWGEGRIMLALDTTLLLERWCVICVSLTYRGRALPLAWRVLRHSSSMVTNKEIRPVLASVQCLLMHLPGVDAVCINADRGFCDQQLMADFTAYGWHWNRRGKGQLYVFDAEGRPLGRVREQLSQHGQFVVLHDVYITANRYGPVSLAAVHARGAKEPWFIISDRACGIQTFSEYHERMQIEEGFLDLKSAAFNLEDTRLTQAHQFEQLLFVLGLASVVVLSEGTALVEAGQRRRIDPHWFRALSYVQLGIRAIRHALTHRTPFLERLRLSAAPDPEPSRRRSCPLALHVVRGFT